MKNRDLYNKEYVDQNETTQDSTFLLEKIWEEVVDLITLNLKFKEEPDPEDIQVGHAYDFKDGICC